MDRIPQAKPIKFEYLKDTNEAKAELIRSGLLKGKSSLREVTWFDFACKFIVGGLSLRQFAEICTNMENYYKFMEEHIQEDFDKYKKDESEKSEEFMKKLIKEELDSKKESGEKPKSDENQIQKARDTKSKLQTKDFGIVQGPQDLRKGGSSKL